MLVTLDGPADHQHGARLGHLARQIADGFGRNTANLRRPFRGLFDIVFGLAEEVGQKAVETQGVGVDELLVVEIFGVQRVRHRQHQRHVGQRIDVLMRAIEVIAGLGAHRVNAENLDFLFGDLFLEFGEVGVGFVGFSVPAHLLVLDRVAGPPDDELRLLEQDVPGRALRIDLGRTKNVRQDDLAGTGRIVAGGTDCPTVHPDSAQHVVAAAMHLPDRAPADVTRVQRLRAVVLLDTLQFFVKEVNGLIPGNADEAVVTALGAVTLFTVLVPVQAHHRITDTRGTVDRADQSVDHFGRMGVVFKRLDLDHTVALDAGANRAPERTGDFPAGKVLGGLVITWRLRPRSRNKDFGSKHGSPGNQAQCLQKLTAIGIHISHLL